MHGLLEYQNRHWLCCEHTKSFLMIINYKSNLLIQIHHPYSIVHSSDQAEDSIRYVLAYVLEVGTFLGSKRNVDLTEDHVCVQEVRLTQFLGPLI